MDRNLLEHTEEVLQWLPLAVLAAGLVVQLGAVLRRRPALLTAYRMDFDCCDG